MTLLEQANAKGIEGFLHPAELQKLHELATGRDVLEVGSFRGLSAWGMAQTAKSLTCVDTFCAADDGQRQLDGMTTMDDFLRAVCHFDNVTVFVGTSEEGAEEFGARTYDMIFLDANHEYESVRDDIERWWPLLRPKGILVFHDYGHDHFKGVKQAVDERFGDLGPYDEHQKTWLVTLRWVWKP